MDPRRINARTRQADEKEGSAGHMRRQARDRGSTKQFTAEQAQRPFTTKQTTSTKAG